MARPGGPFVFRGGDTAMTLVGEKIQQAIALLDDLAIDCWITFVRESEINADPMLAYVLGGHVTWHSAFVICRSGTTIAVVGQGDRQTVNDSGVYGEVRGYVQDFSPSLIDVLQTLRPSRIALNYSSNSEIADGLTHGMYLTFMDALRRSGCSAEVVPAETLISALRGRKTEAERVATAGAIRIALEIFDGVGGTLRAGVSEAFVARAMHAEAARRGCPLAWSPETCPGVFAGPAARDLHARPGARLLEVGHLVYIDFGVKHEGYCSDLQRVYFVGGPGGAVPPDVGGGFDVLVEGIDRARLAMRPGVLGVDVDRIVREWLSSRGYEDFPHALGHQVGRFVHDGFALLGPAWEKYAQRPFAPIEEGMIFTIEPRLQVPGRGTISIEEMVVVTATGAEFLSPPQQRLIVV